MTPHNELRLLPWTDPDGKPCFLSTDSRSSRMSRVADHAEATQLDAGAKLLKHAAEALAGKQQEPKELRFLATALSGALRDALRIAESRGHRLPTPNPAVCEGAEGPQLPAAACG